MGLSHAVSFRGRGLATGLASTALIAGVLLGGATGAAAARPPDVPKGSVDVQLLAINDFHGQLPTPSGSGGRILGTNAGGIVYLAAHLRELEATNPNTLFLSGGDLIGASPLISGVLHDEPTIEAMNLLGMDFAVVGNHEFDEGLAELYRMQDGGCNPIDGCQTGHTFAGADFQYLAANVVGPNGHPIFPAYKIRSFGGAKIGIIGVVTKTTPTIVTPSGVAGLTFLDETATVNTYAAELKAKGVNTIVVLLHEGNSKSGATVNACPAIDSGFGSMVSGMDPAVKVVISAHSHQFYNCMIGGKIVTEASSAGRMITDIDLTIERSSDTVTEASANNVVVTRDVTPDPAASDFLAYYTDLVAPLANQVIGSITGDITRAPSAAGESALGDVIADAQLAATSSASTGNAVVAFMNPGGIRTDLLFADSSGGELPGQVTYGEVFAVQPFSNGLVTKTMTGAQIKAVLEQQVFPGTMLQLSNGLTYTWTAAQPAGSRVTNLQLNGVPLGDATTYRVTMNSFLATGGDGFSGFNAGTDPLVGGTDLDALVAYFVGHSPVAPGPQNRITLGL